MNYNETIIKSSILMIVLGGAIAVGTLSSVFILYNLSFPDKLETLNHSIDNSIPPSTNNGLIINYLVDFVGNWSNLESCPANGRYFTDYSINHEIELFGAATFELKGNGNLMFNLTTHDCERNLTTGDSLLFNWMDFGPLDDACYIGVVLRFRIDTGETKIIYVGKHFHCLYGNGSVAVLKFASPIVELGTVWEQWGIKMNPFFEFFNTTSMTLFAISFIHQSTDANNGPRFVRYSQPLLVGELPKSSESTGAFLGTFTPSPSDGLITNYLVDFVGNWSNLESCPANGRYFTDYSINHEIELFGAATFELKGNGNLMFNLTTHDCERNLTTGDSLLFNWMDFGPLDDACYIGVVLRFRIDTGETKIIYVGKHFHCLYGNGSVAVLKFASPIVELGTVWEQWGIKMNPFFEFFNTTSMTLFAISFIHQSTDANNGPRFVRYSQPLLVDELPKSTESTGAFLGTFTPEWLVPSPPLNLQATAGNNKIYLTWEAPSDNGSSNILDYRIYRSTALSDYSLLGITSGTELIDATVINGQTYHYIVTARNIVGESDISNEVTVTPISSTSDSISTTMSSSKINGYEITPGFTIFWIILPIFLILGIKKRKLYYKE
ncbi:MAG: hypothetical protein ACFFB2_06585 [Promethearchaeota archaeon]